MSSSGKHKKSKNLNKQDKKSTKIRTIQLITRLAGHSHTQRSGRCPHEGEPQCVVGILTANLSLSQREGPGCDRVSGGSPHAP